ncbi:MAG: DUF456 family protein [Dethiobacter sp.]|nr:DUF456 family protein [Dethiobacter sp.]MCL5982829.1 DUF456 domain-containing protein [Bacillota bacterium]
MPTVALVLAVILFVLGLAGIVLPVLPGVILIYGGMLLYGLLTGFAALDANFYLLQGMALLLTFFIDYLAATVGTRRYGGSRRAAWGAAAGILLGGFLLGPFGVVIGPFLGAVLAELSGGKQLEQSIRIGVGTLIGFLGGTVLKFGIAGLMIIWFFVSI